VLSSIENKRELQLLKNKELEDSILSTLQFKNLETKKLREKDNKVYKEFLLSKLFFEQQLLLTTKSTLLLLDIRLFFIIIKSKASTIITRVFLQIITKFVLANQDNNVKVCECIEINIDLRYKINYYSRISTKVLYLVKLIIFKES